MTEQLRDRASRSLPTASVRHGRLRRHSAWKTLLAVLGGTMAVVMVSGVSVAAIAVNQLNQNIDVVELVDEAGEERPVPTLGEWEGGFNVLLVGVDNAEGQADGGSRGSAVLNDVNILVHVAEDQQSAVAISIPRDMVVPVPSCPRPEGGNYSAMSAQPINVAMSYGGLSCVVLTVEALTGLDVPYAGIITFDGVARMSSAVGGVDVCVDGPINDRYTGLVLPEAGTYSLEGGEALAFLRTRYGVGDGSDLGRISSQQVYLSSLIRKVQTEGVLTDLTKLYGLATVATTSMQLSSSIARPDTMVSMALVLRDIPTENISFVQYPSTTGGTGVYLGKVQPIRSQAEALFDKIRNGESFLLEEGETGVGSTTDPNAPAPEPDPSTPAPTTEAGPTVPPLEAEEPAEVLTGVKGQTAADFTCAVSN